MAKSNLSPLFVFGGIAAAILIFLSQKKEPQSSETKALSAPQQGDIATALQALGIDAAGKATRKATPTAVARARSLAKTLSAAGFPEAAATLNSYAALAEKAK